MPTEINPVNPPIDDERTAESTPSAVSTDGLDLIDASSDLSTTPEPTQPDTQHATRNTQHDPDFQQPLWDHLIEEEQQRQQAKNKVDELWDEAVAFVRDSGKASTSMLQRRFRIGYTRSARIIDAMEDAGIIGPPTGTSKATGGYFGRIVHLTNTLLL